VICSDMEGKGDMPSKSQTVSSLSREVRDLEHEVYAIGDQAERWTNESFGITLQAVKRLAEKMGVDPRDIFPAGIA
jgi:hypothetical protein